LLFAPADDDHALKQQLAIVGSHTAGFEERDLKVFNILGDTAAAQSLREKVHADGHAFEVVLLGKDGGIKLRRKKPVSAQELFSTIDKMPMRRAEMRPKW